MRPPINKIFVLAGNYDQFKVFLYDIHKSLAGESFPFVRTDWIYISSPTTLLGMTDIWGYKVGTWRERKDINDLATMIHIHGSSLENDFIEV